MTFDLQNCKIINAPKFVISRFSDNKKQIKGVTNLVTEIRLILIQFGK